MLEIISEAIMLKTHSLYVKTTAKKKTNQTKVLVENMYANIAPI